MARVHAAAVPDFGFNDAMRISWFIISISIKYSYIITICNQYIIAHGDAFVTSFLAWLGRPGRCLFLHVPCFFLCWLNLSRVVIFRNTTAATPRSSLSLPLFPSLLNYLKYYRVLGQMLRPDPNAHLQLPVSIDILRILRTIVSVNPASARKAGSL